MTSERLNVLDELEPPDLWNEIEGRQPSREPVAAFMPRRPRALTFAVAAAIGIASILVATSALGPNSIPLDRPVLRSAGQDLDGWTVGVEVRHSSGGPLEIQVGPIHAAKENDAHPWIQHEVILTNTGSETLHFDDIRTSTFLGANHELLAADQGCGYARNGPNALVEPGACLLYLDAFSIPPGGTVRREVTLFKDLPGMAPLTAGKYVFEKMYRFAIGSSDTKTTVHVRLIYDVDKA